MTNQLNITWARKEMVQRGLSMYYRVIKKLIEYKMYNINKLQCSRREYPINYTFKSFKKGRKKTQNLTREEKLTAE